MSVSTKSRIEPTFPDRAAIDAWIEKNGVTVCQPAIAYGIAVDVAVPPDPDADRRVNAAWRAKHGFKTLPWRGNRLNEDGKAKAIRTRQQQIHDRKRKCEPSGG